METTFTLRSNNIGGQVTSKYVFDEWGCSGENVSPHLSWSNPPVETKSFAITMYDPDAPTGSGFWHWLAFSIPTSVTELAEGASGTDSSGMPDGVTESLNDYGNHGYGGPCPPVGDGMHQYIITVFALSVEKLDLSPDTNPAVVGFNLNANVIQKASIISYFERK